MNEFSYKHQLNMEILQRRQVVKRKEKQRSLKNLKRINLENKFLVLHGSQIVQKILCV